MGMSRREIAAKFDEIVAFSEIEDWIDTPIKRYSSGMHVRLGFAVAAHLDPDILLVDEVLAVGDAAFQQKCMGKMDTVAQEGRTVVFVSHNMAAITTLCKGALWLDEGRIVAAGLSTEIVSRYQSQFLTTCAEWQRPDTAKGDSALFFLNATVRNREGEPASLFSGDEPVSLEISYEVRKSLRECQIGARIYNSDGLVLFTTTDADKSGVAALPREPGNYRSRFTIPGSLLPPGTYYLLLAAHSPNIRVYETIEQTVIFEIGSPGSLTSVDGRLGAIAPLLSWQTNKEALT